MTLAYFRRIIRCHFGEGSNHQEITGEMNNPFPCFQALVTVQGASMEIHLANPHSRHWNAFPEPPQGEDKGIVGARSANEALRLLASKF